MGNNFGSSYINGEVTGTPTTSEQSEATQQTQQDAKPNGLASTTNTQINPGGSLFDPSRWKTTTDTRLDPNAKIKPASFSKVDVRKPPADHFIRAHHDPAFNGVFPLYSDSLAKRYEPYLIAPDLVLPPQAQVNVKQTRLAVTITDTGHLFLWHVAQTGSDWHESGDNAILTAMARWVKVISDGSGYRLEFPQANLPEPVFPAWEFEEYIRRTFGGERNRYVANLEHDLVKRLAGIR